MTRAILWVVMLIAIAVTAFSMTILRYSETSRLRDEIARLSESLQRLKADEETRALNILSQTDYNAARLHDLEEWATDLTEWLNGK